MLPAVAAPNIEGPQVATRVSDDEFIITGNCRVDPRVFVEYPDAGMLLIKSRIEAFQGCHRNADPHSIVENAGVERRQVYCGAEPREVRVLANASHAGDPRQPAVQRQQTGP